MKILMKLFSFNIRPFQCLIFGKESKKDCVRQPQDNGVKSFTEALIISDQDYGFCTIGYNECIDFEQKTYCNSQAFMVQTKSKVLE